MKIRISFVTPMRRVRSPGGGESGALLEPPRVDALLASAAGRRTSRGDGSTISRCRRSWRTICRGFLSGIRTTRLCTRDGLKGSSARGLGPSIIFDPPPPPLDCGEAVVQSVTKHFRTADPSTSLRSAQDDTFIFATEIQVGLRSQGFEPQTGTAFEVCGCLPGFEPRYAESESAVLPLNEEATDCVGAAEIAVLCTASLCWRPTL